MQVLQPLSRSDLGPREAIKEACSIDYLELARPFNTLRVVSPVEARSSSSFTNANPLEALLAERPLLCWHVGLAEDSADTPYPARQVFGFAKQVESLA